MKNDEIMVINNFCEVDVFDDSLYSYENFIFSLTPFIEQNIRVNLIDKLMNSFNNVIKVNSAIDSSSVKETLEIRYDSLSAEVLEAFKAGNAELVKSKKSNGTYYFQLKSVIDGLVVNGKKYGKNRKIADIPFSIGQTPKDVLGAMNTLATHNQLNGLSRQLSEISNIIDIGFERVIEGQINDRISKLLSCRNSFIQALVINDKDIQKQLLVNGISEMNTARAQLIFQLKSEIPKLDKAKKRETNNIVKGIHTTLLAINNAVQLLLYTYRFLGEWKAQIALIKDQENFIKQILLKEFHDDETTYTVWKKIISNAESSQNTKENLKLPYQLLSTCRELIDERKEITINGN